MPPTATAPGLVSTLAAYKVKNRASKFCFFNFKLVPLRDGTAKLWDLRRRGCVATFPDKFQITAVAFAADGDKFYSGGIDNELKVGRILCIWW
jgi:WD40 repeat protein